MKGIRLAGSWELTRRVGVISVDFETIDNAEAAYQLEQDYGILTRCGLHCAPAAHKTLGTFPQGAVRFPWALQHLARSTTWRGRWRNCWRRRPPASAPANNENLACRIDVPQA